MGLHGIILSPPSLPRSSWSAWYLFDNVWKAWTLYLILVLVLDVHLFRFGFNFATNKWSLNAQFALKSSRVHLNLRLIPIKSSWFSIEWWGTPRWLCECLYVEKLKLQLLLYFVVRTKPERKLSIFVHLAKTMLTHSTIKQPEIMSKKDWKISQASGTRCW